MFFWPPKLEEKPTDESILGWEEEHHDSDHQMPRLDLGVSDPKSAPPEPNLEPQSPTEKEQGRNSPHNLPRTAF